ncbi:hypothetical protein HBH98_172550 [Parastagonospora nodorum]|nr:hypothetical protein HBH53_245250 [Parastagonospora nodorum]KAH3968551.1 hypothetical protein HBH52_180770 [Parastagonospora nodorum]KAH4008868.1 hypothetical protein HBI13_227470 [Parastagonospora nodorum]KAH4064153.1 hypothetical protein HBH50_183600 [Parastagonospora nodorum]KAH4082831.1 hypothetical protein HBH48_184170 [Parastagonospora nodorum]
MTEAMNAISNFLTVPHHDYMSATNRASEHVRSSLIVTRQALQDKLLRPTIESLDQLIAAANADATRLTSQRISVAGNMVEPEASGKLAQLQTHLQDTKQQLQEDLRLKLLLENLLAIVLDEKDEAVAKRTDTKRKRSLEDTSAHS